MRQKVQVAWIAVLALLVCGAAIAGSVTQTITERQLRDPKQMLPILNDNFAEIDDRTDGTTAMDITTDDITAAGADTASLDINVPASTNAQNGTITVKSAQTVANLTDLDYIEYNLLNMYNSATAAVDYVYLRAVADDVTTATEDGALEFYIEINSTATKVLDIDAAAVDCGTLPINATGGDMGDAALANVGAITADSLDADAAGALPIGASTATSLDLHKSGSATTVKGTFNVDEAATFDTTVGITGAATLSDSLEVQGTFTLGTNGAAGLINTSDWDIDVNGNMSGIGSIAADGALTLSSSATVIGGGVTSRWDDAASKIDGEQIADDTIDNDSIDWGDMADLDTDGAVSWGNIAEGELANSTVISADIKDDSIVNADINSAAAIALTKLGAVDPGYIIVGNATSQSVAVAVSGVITVATNGLTAFANSMSLTNVVGGVTNVYTIPYIP